MIISENRWATLESAHLNDKLPLNEIVVKYNIKYTTLYYGFKRRKVPITLYEVDRRKYSVNDRFFNKIDTENKAYILGLLASDGYLCKGNTVCIKLKEEDRYIVEFVRDCLAPTKPVFLDKNIMRGKTFKSYKVEVCSDELCIALRKLGVVERKTGKEIMPILPSKEMYKHFVRGYFDGDGSISKRKGTGPAKSCQMYICCSSREFLVAMQKQLGFGNIYTEKRSTVDMHTLRFTSVESKLKLYNYMYINCTVAMKRKFVMYVEYVNTVLNR